MKIVVLFISYYIKKIHDNYYLERIFKYTLKKGIYSDWKKYLLLSHCFKHSTEKERKKVSNSIDIKNILI